MLQKVGAVETVELFEAAGGAAETLEEQTRKRVERRLEIVGIQLFVLRKLAACGSAPTTVAPILWRHLAVGQVRLKRWKY